MNGKVHILFVIPLCAALICLGACRGEASDGASAVDSLNCLAARAKYRSLAEAARYVDKALERCEKEAYVDGLYEAWLNRGDVYGMGMCYDSARICYQKVLEESDNDLLCAVADVDMMSVCLMLAMNKEFYDYRSDALDRMAGVREESSDMTAHQRRLWNEVCCDYHFVSLNYFVKMRQDEGVEAELEWLDAHEDLFAADTARLSTWLYACSMDGVGVRTWEDAEDECQRSLLRLLSISRQSGMTYFEICALNALARSVMEGGAMKPSRRVFVEELMGGGDSEPIEYRMADRALSLSKDYGNDFLSTMVLVTLSNYYLRHGEDSLAVARMEEGLSMLNNYHRRVYAAQGLMLADSDTLKIYAADAPGVLSTEMRWIEDANSMAVPEWMAMVREQLSVVFGTMGKKKESDYNHNVYFDILDVTRQDLRVVQEEENLKEEQRALNLILWTFVVVLAALAVLLVVWHRRSRRLYRKRVEMLGRMADICKDLSSVLVQTVGDEEEMEKALHRVSDNEVERLFPKMQGEDWTVAFARNMDDFERELFHVLQVFFKWIRQRGMQFVHLENERERIESETYVLGKRLEEDKRQYVERLTSLSIVQSITPFLNRALHEANKLRTGVGADVHTVEERFRYIGELLDKINEYNEVLGHWVKIRRGLVSLRIENFSLEPLLATLRRSAKGFELKGVALQVDETEAVVKADKALTLFMMNTLLDNARKYTAAGGKVTLTTRVEENYVEVSVEDTGCGLSPEDVATLNGTKVYDSGKIGVDEANGAEGGSNKGFGFGLMNCKGVIERYRRTGALFDVCMFGVESRKGQGSRFFFRLPKGVLRVMMWMLLFMCVNVSYASVFVDETADSQMAMARSYVDSLYASNVEGEHERAVLFADSAIACLNRYCVLQYPDCRDQMKLESGSMAELEWLRNGYEIDYDLIIRLRNEVVLAALSTDRYALYRYNNEVFTRLYKTLSTDVALENYCNDMRMANRNKETAVVLLGALIVFVLLVCFFLHYHNTKLFIFNLRQFIQLSNRVFASDERTLPEMLLQSLSDVKAADVLGVMTPTKDVPDKLVCVFAGHAGERGVYESVMRSAYQQGRELVVDGGRFRAFPMYVSNHGERLLTGVLGVRFYDGKLLEEESVVINLVVAFMSIHTYFSCRKVYEIEEFLELRQDERMRMENEQQRVYVRNQIMDNSLSALKHETMYFPNRIKQMVDAVLVSKKYETSSDEVADIEELLAYYKEVFTILSTCVAGQVERSLYKRTNISSSDIASMALQSFKRQRKKVCNPVSMDVVECGKFVVQGDVSFMKMLVDQIISLYFEHASGGNITLCMDEVDGFAVFVFHDTAYQYDDTEVSRLFYVENLVYDAEKDVLRGTQYMMCRQIIREFDSHSSRRGCRIYVENDVEGKGSRFVFTLPVVRLSIGKNE